MLINFYIKSIICFDTAPNLFFRKIFIMQIIMLSLIAYNLATIIQSESFKLTLNSLYYNLLNLGDLLYDNSSKIKIYKYPFIYMRFYKNLRQMSL